MDIEEMKKRIVKKYPAFENIISDTEFIPNEKGHLAYTDGISVYYNPIQIENYDKNQQLFILSHEVCHIAFDHIGRAKGKNSHLWGIAADSVVNAYLRKDGLKPIPGSIHNPDAIDYDAETYYEILKEKQKKKMNFPSMGKKGSLSNKSRTPGEGKNSMETETPPDQDPNQPSGAPEEMDQREEQNNSESQVSDDSPNNHSSSKDTKEKEHSNGSSDGSSSSDHSSDDGKKENPNNSSKKDKLDDSKSEESNENNTNGSLNGNQKNSSKKESNSNFKEKDDSKSEESNENNTNGSLNGNQKNSSKKGSNSNSKEKDDSMNEEKNSSSKENGSDRQKSRSSEEEDDFDFDEGDHAIDNHENWDEYSKDLDARRKEKNQKSQTKSNSSKKEKDPSSNGYDSTRERNGENSSSSKDANQKEKKNFFQKVKDFLSDVFHKGKDSKEEKENQEDSSQPLDDEDFGPSEMENSEKSKSQKDIEKFSNMGEPDAFSENRDMRREKLEDLKEELESYSPFAGNTTDSINRELQEIGKSSKIVNWKRLLKESIRYDMDWSYRHATIEYGVIKSHLEEMPKSETEILLDTSGSINEDLLRNFLKECKNVVESSKVKVGCFDTEFYGFQEIRSMKDIENLKFTGGGGTDFECAVTSFTKRVDNKIIFTDGYADDPNTPMDAIWVVFGNTPIHPKGGKVIHIDEESLKELSTPGYKVYQRGGRV